MYSTPNHQEIASEDVHFNACFTSSHAPVNYAYISFAPKNATINFYSDPACKEFTFGLNGFFGQFPGPASSYKWVGWTEDAIGFLQDKTPFQGQGDAAPGAVVKPPGGQNPGGGGGGDPSTHPTPGPDNSKGGDKNEDSRSPISSIFFGSVFGSLIVMFIGGVVFWKTVGKKMVEDTKGKSVLPYNRVVDNSGDQDEDILLRTKNRMDHFELVNEDDDDDDHEGSDDDSRANNGHQREQEQRTERQDRYQDDREDSSQAV